ncbi:MAG: hypothetical protein GTO18_20870 [Anaerolineales bacterium]|nr:hypothetical protein [Anaerolineales bacterium]
MDEVRCPMCSKPNPDDAEECTFCGARITPLVVEQPSEEPPIEEAQEPFESTEEVEPAEPVEETPRSEVDWLSRMRGDIDDDDEGKQLEEEELEATQLIEEKAETPPDLGKTDFLGRMKALGIQEDEEPEPVIEEPEELDVPEEIDFIGDEQLLEDAAEEILPEIETGEPDVPEEIDFLSDEQLLEDVTEEIPPEIETGEPDVPDWLARVRARKLTDELLRDEELEESDWLSGLREGEELDEDEVIESLESAIEDDIISELFDEDELPESATPVSEDAVSDVIDSVETQEDIEPVDEKELVAEYFGEGIEDEPDVPEEGTGEFDLEEVDTLAATTLKDLFGDVELPSADEAIGAIPEEVEDDLEALEAEDIAELLGEDLLDDLEAPTKDIVDILGDDLVADVEEDQVKEEEVELDPKFLADIGLDVPQDIEAILDEELAAFDAELIDEASGEWDESFLALEPEAVESVDLAPGSDELLRDTTLEEADLIESEPLDSPPFTEVEGEKRAEIPGLDAVMPDWLEESDQPIDEELPHVPALILDDELPPITSVGEGGIDEATVAEIPVWLQDLREDVDEEEEGEDVPELAKAKLPPWLEAMRPIETFRAKPEIEPIEEEEIVEAAGPLAGLKGVLLAEPVVAMPRSPGAAVSALDVTELDYSKAEILQRMVDEEEREEALSPEKITRLPILNWIIAFLIIIVAVIPLILGIPNFNSPTRAPRDLSQFLDLIRSIPPSEPVLVIFDYEPGFSTEMDAVAGTLVEDLVGNGQRVATLSTRPTGPLMADLMLRNVGSMYGAQNGIDYIHLGYLPGGPLAMSLFGVTPREALVNGFNMPEDIDWETAWDSPILQDVSQLSDLGMIVILTANTETARNWVEQLEPYAGAVPTVMVLSAGVEPLIRPYFESEAPQIEGILTGIPSAMIYEGVIGRMGAATEQWNAYGTAILVAVLILIGGLIYGLWVWFFRTFRRSD